MLQHSNQSIKIAAALVHDGKGKMLLVRKCGTPWFMQAGGKIEPGESPSTALARELEEELGISIRPADFRYVGQFHDVAANERETTVEATVFVVEINQDVAIRSEIEEAIWVTKKSALAIPLAPLTKNHILPIFSTTYCV